MKRVIVELKTKVGWSAESIMRMTATLPGFQIDETYEPVPTEPSEELVSTLAPGEEVILIRGLVEEGKEAELKTAPNVLAVWTDGRIEPF